jgi:dTDP-4-dehydrorhamnose 3,5-epimerase
MQAEHFPIEGPLLLTPAVHGDDRGHFLESWNRRRFAELLGVALDAAPVFDQDNQSLSCRGVLRGLHYQLPPEPQGKLVRCVAGEIFDVAVDLRRSSATYGRWLGVRLSGDNHQQLWVPPGFAHGFLTLSARAQVLYKTSGFWNRDCERAIRWDDPRLGIQWPLADLAAGAEPMQPLLSPKDAIAPDLAAAEAAGDVFP